MKEFNTINYYRYKNERTTSYPEEEYYQMGYLSETSASGGNRMKN